MPVPQTFTSGAFGFATKWSANSMQTFRLPCPAPSPRTAAPSMYAFWLMSSFALLTRPADAPQMRHASTTAEFMFGDTNTNSICWRYLTSEIAKAS